MPNDEDGYKVFEYNVVRLGVVVNLLLINLNMFVDTKYSLFSNIIMIELSGHASTASIKLAIISAYENNIL
jgi:hypothetical protein